MNSQDNIDIWGSNRYQPGIRTEQVLNRVQKSETKQGQVRFWTNRTNILGTQNIRKGDFSR